MRKLKNEELNRISVEEFKQTNKTPLVVVLDNIRSLNNIGSVFRTADAFLIEKIYLCGITAQPPHNEIRKTALGATESVEWEYVKETQEAIEKLKSQNYVCIALEQVENSIMLNDFQPQAAQKYAVVFGNEVKGVQQKIVDLCNFTVEIPQLGTKHSLNIAVSAGIVLWDLFSKYSKLQ